MFRLLGFLVMFTLTAGGFMVVDYKMSARWAGREDAEGLTFREYLGGLSGRIAGLGAGGSNGMPTKLADMLPKPPEGWKVRPVEAGDTDGFLPKNSKKADKAGVAAVAAMAKGEAGSGVEVAALTYEKGDRKLIKAGFEIPVEHIPQAMDWSVSNFKRLRDIGYEAGLKLYAENKELLQ